MSLVPWLDAVKRQGRQRPEGGALREGTEGPVGIRGAYRQEEKEGFPWGKCPVLKLKRAQVMS